MNDFIELIRNLKNTVSKFNYDLVSEDTIESLLESICLQIKSETQWKVIPFENEVNIIPDLDGNCEVFLAKTILDRLRNFYKAVEEYETNLS